jgi:hypothetical protein
MLAMNSKFIVLVAGMLTTSLLPIRPFEDLAKHQCITREVEEFTADNDKQSAYPFTVYLNHLYIHPRSLKYDGQKAFQKVLDSVVYYV